MGTATGVFGWSPSEFWKSTLIEFMAARRAWVMANTSGDEAKALRWQDSLPDDDEVK